MIQTVSLQLYDGNSEAASSMAPMHVHNNILYTVTVVITICWLCICMLSIVS